MQTLSHGYKKPDDQDTGDVVFPAMAENIQRLNDHNHDGSNSAPLGSKSQILDPANWSVDPNTPGLYVMDVVMPIGMNYDVCDIWFKFSTGEIVYPTVERDGGNSYKVYTNDPTKTYVAFYR